MFVRLAALFTYLSAGGGGASLAGADWERHLGDDGVVLWETIAVGGHSRGAGYPLILSAAPLSPHP